MLVTISGLTLANWQGGVGVFLRVFNNKSFTAITGTIYTQSQRNNAPSLGTFYQQWACTVAGQNLTIPDIQLDSTTDSPDNPDATYSAVLWDAASNQPIQGFGTVAAFAVPPASPVTWAALFAAETQQ